MRKISLLIFIMLIGFVLRFYQLGINPRSLYWDEVSLGYNAFSILTTGHDEHGEFYPLDRFIAFGDYKPPGYIYATVPSIAVFGLNEFAVRFPSAVAGSVMIVFTYLLCLELFANVSLALIAALLLAISPWSIQLSRAAFEANLAACFNLMGVYWFLKSRQRSFWLIPATVAFMLSFYTFNANRIIAPLLAAALGCIYWRDMRRIIPALVVCCVLAVVLLLPSWRYLMSQESKLRYNEVSIFMNLAPVETANLRIARQGNTVLAKLIDNRRVAFALDFLKHYSDNFSGRFLFTHGDRNPRLHVQEMGELYAIELPFLLIGGIMLWRCYRRAFYVITVWMLIAPIPAGVARETPHALRIVSILPTYQILIASGVWFSWQWLKQKRFAAFVLAACCLLLTASMYYYLHQYYVHYPYEWSGEWQYGYKEMVQTIADLQDQYDKIYITPAVGRPYINVLFYQHYPADAYLRERVADRDWYGFWTVSAMGKITYDLQGASSASGRVLLVTTKDVPGGFTVVKTIKNLHGDTAFIIAEKK